MTQEILTERQFCYYVKISRFTAFRMRKAGTLPHFKLNRRILYSYAHIEQFLKNYEVVEVKGGGANYVA
jgi:hypothetical protein